jgi:hypothetical protein
MGGSSIEERDAARWGYAQERGVKQLQIANFREGKIKSESKQRNGARVPA